MKKNNSLENIACPEIEKDTAQAEEVYSGATTARSVAKRSPILIQEREGNP